MKIGDRVLALQIFNQELNQISHLYLEKNGSKYETSGFTIQNGKLMHFDPTNFELLKLFILGKNQKEMGIQDGYKVILDLDTNLYHFFKDGKEDLEKLYYCNGKSAISYSTDSIEKKEGKARKFTFKKYKDIIIMSVSIFAILVSCYNLYYIKENMEQVPYTINGETKKLNVTHNIFGVTKLFLEDETETYTKGITSNDIKEAIFSSSALNDIEKEFLWNEQLITDLIPYYQGTNYDSLIRIRHREIDIVSFTEEELENESFKKLSGYQIHGNNVLHIRDYEPEKLNNDPYTIENVGHEDIHLLQANTPFIFFGESTAEIMSHEYFLKSGDLSYPYTYDYANACCYTKVLMEIIGTEPILKCVFSGDSTDLEESISPYLSEQEFKELMELLKLDLSEVEIDYDRIEELLSIMYQNKFNSNMEENGLINAILTNSNYNRIYFNSSLMQTSPSYYVSIEKQKMTLEEAYNEGLIYCCKFIKVSAERYYNNEFSDIMNAYFGLEGLNGYITLDGSKVEYIDGKYIGSIIMQYKDDENNTIELEINEAIASGYVKPVYTIKYEVPFDKDDKDIFVRLKNNIETNHDSITTLDSKNETVTITTFNVKNYVDPINSNVENRSNTR